MNYRTTFDTVNVPANTKKNIKVLNEVALQRQQEQALKSGKQEAPATASTAEDSLSSVSKSPTSKKTVASGLSSTSGGGSESDSEGEDEESLIKSAKESTLSEKQAKKKEW
jgi:hypothetical protein